MDDSYFDEELGIWVTRWKPSKDHHFSKAELDYIKSFAVDGVVPLKDFIEAANYCLNNDVTARQQA